MALFERYTAAGLAEVLQRYGDLPVLVAVSDADGNTEMTMEVRVLMGMLPNGGRCVQVCVEQDDLDNGLDIGPEDPIAPSPPDGL